MLAAVNVIPENSLDFADGAMRFNWCNCQPSAHKGVGNLPMFDFGFWNNTFTGGGSATAVPETPAAGSFPATMDVKTIALIGAVGLAAFFALKGGRR